ncbi:hypothetical protein ACHAO1_010440 [Botrytis cinerea]
MSDIAAYAPHYSWANKSTGWAENIFNEAVAEFIATLPKKSSQLESFLDLKPSTLDDIVKCVSKAQLQYEDRRGDSKIRRCLTSFAQKVHCYGTVMDAVVQQAPEYVSLVYGAMKLVLVGVVNHEKSLAIIMDSLCSVADVLPRMENTVNLYPTVQMRKFMIMLYAQIIKFLTVSLSWFKESKALHILHSFTRPPELCYSDLVQKIGNLSQSISTAAQFSSFAEQRDMHSVMNNIMSRQESLEDKVDDKFTKIFQELCELKTTMVTAQTLNSSAQVSMHQQLSQLQLMSFINNLSLNVTLDPTKSLQIYFFARKRQQARQAGGSAFWLAPKMQNWNSSMASSLLMVKGGYKLRNHMKVFCRRHTTASRVQHTCNMGTENQRTSDTDTNRQHNHNRYYQKPHTPSHQPQSNSPRRTQSLFSPTNVHFRQNRGRLVGSSRICTGRHPTSIHHNRHPTSVHVNIRVIHWLFLADRNP